MKQLFLVHPNAGNNSGFTQQLWSIANALMIAHEAKRNVAVKGGFYPDVSAPSVSVSLDHVFDIGAINANLAKLGLDCRLDVSSSSTWVEATSGSSAHANGVLVVKSRFYNPMHWFTRHSPDTRFNVLANSLVGESGRQCKATQESGTTLVIDLGEMFLNPLMWYYEAAPTMVKERLFQVIGALSVPNPLLIQPVLLAKKQALLGCCCCSWNQAQQLGEQQRARLGGRVESVAPPVGGKGQYMAVHLRLEQDWVHYRTSRADGHLPISYVGQSHQQYTQQVFPRYIAAIQRLLDRQGSMQANDKANDAITTIYVATSLHKWKPVIHDPTARGSSVVVAGDDPNKGLVSLLQQASFTRPVRFVVSSPCPPLLPLIVEADHQPLPQREVEAFIDWLICKEAQLGFVGSSGSSFSNNIALAKGCAWTELVSD